MDIVERQPMTGEALTDALQDKDLMFRSLAFVQHLCADAAKEIQRLRALVGGKDDLSQALVDDNEQMRELLTKARSGLADGLWDYGPGQDEHEQCNALVAEIDAVLFHNSQVEGQERSDCAPSNHG